MSQFSVFSFQFSVFSFICILLFGFPSSGLKAPKTENRKLKTETPAPFRADGGRRVRLWDGEQITGQILDINKDALRLRTAWAARLELPRAAVASVDPLPGWRTVAEENFRAGAKERTHTLTRPLRAGRIGVNFQEQGTVELLFQQGDHSRRVTVTVAEIGANYRVDTDGLKGTARAVARTPGWHRLMVRFSEHSLRLTCDDDVLWHNLDEGPGGRLRRVTIRCQQSTNGEGQGGVAAWTEFCLERAVDEHPKPPAETEQDEVRLLDDDQLFGRIVQADRRTIEIEGRFGKRSLPWTAVSGCSFRRPAAPPRANAGATVRLLLRSGLCAESDVLEGVVTALDERQLVLRHALLGELTFERGRIRQRLPLPSGSR